MLGPLEFILKGCEDFASNLMDSWFLVTFVLYREHPLHQRQYFPGFTVGGRRFPKLEERDWGVDPEVNL